MEATLNFNGKTILFTSSGREHRDGGPNAAALVRDGARSGRLPVIVERHGLMRLYPDGGPDWIVRRRRWLQLRHRRRRDRPCGLVVWENMPVARARSVCLAGLAHDQHG